VREVEAIRHTSVELGRASLLAGHGAASDRQNQLAGQLEPIRRGVLFVHLHVNLSASQKLSRSVH
jgi:hypothetical protein